MDTHSEGYYSMQEQLIVKLLSTDRKDNLTSLKAEDIAKRMGVSKVTMYKYFSSKDEIMEKVADTYAEYIRNVVQKEDKATDFFTQFQNSFEQSLYMIYYLSNHINNFQNHYAELYHKLLEAKRYRTKQLIDFYARGFEEGVFNSVNAHLLTLSDETVLSRILTPSYLIQYGLSLESTLLDYYEHQKRIVISNHQLQKIDDTNVHRFINTFVNKNALNL